MFTQVLQLGSRVTGLVRSAVSSGILVYFGNYYLHRKLLFTDFSVSSVKGEGSALKRREKDTSRRGADGTAGGGGRERVGRGRDGMAEAAEGRVTVPGGTHSQKPSLSCLSIAIIHRALTFENFDQGS